MAALDHVSAAFGSVRPSFAARAINAVAAVLRAWKNRREVYRLGEMTDWELADIGLTRGDLHVAIRAPLTADPTRFLGSAAESRAYAAERAARQVC